MQLYYFLCRITSCADFVQSHEKPIHLVFAIPDHPWVDNTDSAAVRLAMTVGEAGISDGILARVVFEERNDNEGHDIELLETKGQVHSDLRIGANIPSATELKANARLASTGLILGSRGFVITADEAAEYQNYEPDNRKLIFPIRNGRDLTDQPRNVFVIDTNGWSEDELRSRVPTIYQRLLERVYPERQTNRDPKLRTQWWLFRRSNEQVRAAIASIKRYIATPETAKHRFFVFLSQEEKPEHRLVVIGSSDAFFLGVLSSRIHTTWALAAGGTLEDRPVYNKTRCFDPFPFPVCDEQKKARIRELGEALDSHRKRQQAQYPKLTITDMYNVLEKLRRDEPLSDKEKITHEHGLVSVLKQIHDDLDAAVFDAYGWPAASTDAEILERLVALNAERTREEHAGLIRWLRPEFQNPQGATQSALDTGEEKAVTGEAATRVIAPWPKTLADQARAIRNALEHETGAVSAEQLARRFKSARADRVAELLQTLAMLGQAREVDSGRFVV